MMMISKMPMANLAAIVAVAMAANPSSAEKYSYRSSGRGGWAYIGTGPCGDWPFYGYVDVHASQQTYKLKENGNPTTSTPFPSMDAYVSLWTDCSAETATLVTVESYYGDQPTLNFPSNNKLLTGSATGRFPGSLYVCDIARYPYVDDDGNEYEDVYYECNYGNPISVTVDITVTWTGTGSTYPDRYSSINKYINGFYKYSSRGTYRAATVTLDVNVDGSSLNLDEYGVEFKDGSLTKTTSSDMSIYKY
jgi:hypothetical protein